jgi:hypothetical protein
MKQVVLEASDLILMLYGHLQLSMDFDYSAGAGAHCSPNGCHVCKKTPCACEYDAVVNFKS